jgi:hypothetical protein
VFLGSESKRVNTETPVAKCLNLRQLWLKEILTVSRAKWSMTLYELVVAMKVCIWVRVISFSLAVTPLFFQSEMHSFMTAVLLWRRWLDSFNADTEATPPDRQVA